MDPVILSAQGIDIIMEETEQGLERNLSAATSGAGRMPVFLSCMAGAVFRLRTGSARSAFSPPAARG